MFTFDYNCILNFKIYFLYVDIIDVVKDSVDVGIEEDPTIYVSEKTGRGPLNVNWLEEYTTVSQHFCFND